MLIKPGIHENLVFTDKTKINEHGTLELAIGTVESSTGLMDAFIHNKTLDKMESSFRFYPPTMTTFDKAPKTAGDIGEEILKMRHQFMQYAMLFGTKEDAENAFGGVTMFTAAGIPQEDLGKALNMLATEEFAKKITTSLSTLFLKYLQKVNAFSGAVTFRHKFLRQSKEKNYAVIPSSTFDVWVEPMTVTKEQSKIAFSDWEIKNGKDNPDPIASDDGKATQQAAQSAAALFNKPATTDQATPAAPNLFKTPEKEDATSEATEQAPKQDASGMFNNAPES